ncbi:MAG TPA: TraB/GumN family protein, partial [Acidobacteriota bacterium]|nr:TraB/GumN family protein [Acidobacteriota bacterium]
MPSNRPILPLMLLVASLFVVEASAESAFLWKIDSPGGSVFLFGSIHAGEQWIYPLPSKVEDAFRSCKNLAVEVDITKDTDLDAVMEAFIDSAFYPSGDTLQKHISQETFKLVMKELDRYMFDNYRVQRLRPWALAHLVSGLELQKSDVDSQYGVDLYFLKRAPFFKKQIVELETMEFQAKLFST